MLTAPYSIYVNKRPLRVAFLIKDEPQSMAIIDAIVTYNRDRWGGRYNPIVLTDGATLSDAWWSLLEAVDPDVVKSVVPLSTELLGAIERRISPYLVQPFDPREQEPGRWQLHLFDAGLSLLPTASNVRMASWGISDPSLVLFETDWRSTDPVIRRFVEFSFGGYSVPIQTVSRALEQVRKQSYTITDAETLVKPLTELSAFGAFTYPIQLCSLPKEALPDVKYDALGESFHVVIGDSPADVAYFWNRPSTAPQWTRTFLKQVWLPVAVATNPLLGTALSSWLQRLADPSGSYKGRIRFVSLSLSAEQLQEIVEPITSQLHVPQHVHALAETEPPRSRHRSSEPPKQDKMDLYRATGTTERLTLQEPEVLQGAMAGEHWMADLYIEFRPERYPTISGRPLWWQLPQVNGLASQMFSHPSRILRTRYPSVLMKRGEPRLEITLLDDMSVFAILAASPNQPQYTLDARYGQTLAGRTPYTQAWRSEKGRYLSGVLDLFGGLHPAASTLEARYWRRMFDLLSGRTAHTEAERRVAVGNALRKRLGANRAQFYRDDTAMTWLTNYVLKTARSLPTASRDLEFRVFEEQTKREMEDFNRLHAGQEPWQYSRQDLIAAVGDLTAQGVLLMGIQAQCPSCGYREWRHVDDAEQTLQCGGCSAAFPIAPEPRWYYRLNNLARTAYAEHGLLPIVLVLGQLLMEARSAFLFAPCMDLFESEEEGPVGDVDIAVILDGQFVIGEVKQSRDLFDEATFCKMEDIARRLLPDRLLFASMEREPTGLINREITRLSELLRSQRTDVRWYPLHEHKFEPSPVG